MSLRPKTACINSNGFGTGNVDASVNRRVLLVLHAFVLVKMEPQNAVKEYFTQAGQRGLVTQEQLSQLGY
jgi:hypothetical protein